MILRLVILFYAIMIPPPGLARGVDGISSHGSSGSYRISNDKTKIIIAPALGRIMCYGEPGGFNLLWQKPRQAAPPASDAWNNVGGDKIWPWPDECWPVTSEGRLHPPPAWNQAAHELHITGPCSVRMTSPVWTKTGLRIIRDISLDETGTRAVISSFFESSGHKSPPSVLLPVPWSVTQMPLPQAILMRLASPAPDLPRRYALHGFAWDSLKQPAPDILWLASPGGGVSKIGANSRAIGWWRGDLLFIQRLLSPDPHPPAEWSPLGQAQIFWTEKPGDDSTSYVELEFVAPLAPSDIPSPKLVVTWESHHLSSHRPSMDEVTTRFMTHTDPGPFAEPVK
ncbi:MAG: hypothetical protein LBK99_24910 [Opitutaceae bacterium]|nr:hypothetical protein [Opitutaceae bacterium]